MSILSLKGVGKSYGDAAILKDIDLEVAEGEFIAIVGFSGSGKTTLMNILTGLEFPDTGTALYNGDPITGPGSERGLVFQSYSLMPWLTECVHEKSVSCREPAPHCSCRARKPAHTSIVALPPACTGRFTKRELTSASTS